jgi:hypothetical protein
MVISIFHELKYGGGAMVVRVVATSLLLVLLGGCQTTPGRVWNSTANQDQFTDQVTKMVTIGDLKSNTSIVTRSFRYYPFVGVQGDELYVGIRSGGGYRIPTGTVQIRIDDNKAWTIGPDETPVYLVPSLPKTPIAAPPDMTELVEKTTAQAMNNAAKMMSPYTAATGDKAKSIIKEMLAGKIVKYRIVGFNQAASTTGEVNIDESFAQSLREIGIAPESL